MERATKSLDRRDQGAIRPDDLRRFLVSRNDVQDVTQAPGRVPQDRCRVAASQEHAGQAGPQGKAWGKAVSPALTQMTGIAWSYEDPRLRPRSSKPSARTTRSSGSSRPHRGELLRWPAVETQLATMPPKKELRAQLWPPYRPAQKFVALLQAPSQNSSTSFRQERKG